MATTILSRILRNLKNVYKFPSDQKSAPGDVELDLPIQCVHDMSSISEIGAARGFSDGWFIAKTIIIHTATGELESNIFPRSATVRFGVYGAETPIFKASESTLWLFDAWGASDESVGGDFSSFTSGIRYGAYSVGPAEPLGVTSAVFDRMLIYGTSVRAIGSSQYGVENSLNEAPYPLPLPYQETGTLTDDPLLYVRSKADGTGTVEMTWFWLLSNMPKGVRPIR